MVKRWRRGSLRIGEGTAGLICVEWGPDTFPYLPTTSLHLLVKKPYRMYGRKKEKYGYDGTPEVFVGLGALFLLCRLG